MSGGKITIKEIAQSEDVSYITALNWVKSGKIKGIQKGGHWEVERTEYERFRTEGNRTWETKMEEEMSKNEGAAR